MEPLNNPHPKTYITWIRILVSFLLCCFLHMHWNLFLTWTEVTQAQASWIVFFVSFFCSGLAWVDLHYRMRVAMRISMNSEHHQLWHQNSLMVLFRFYYIVVLESVCSYRQPLLLLCSLLMNFSLEGSEN